MGKAVVGIITVAFLAFVLLISRYSYADSMQISSSWT